MKLVIQIENFFLFFSLRAMLTPYICRQMQLASCSLAVNSNQSDEEKEEEVSQNEGIEKSKNNKNSIIENGKIVLNNGKENNCEFEILENF